MKPQGINSILENWLRTKIWIIAIILPLFLILDYLIINSLINFNTFVINGCTIKEQTQCPNANLSGFNASVPHRFRIDLKGANLRGADLRNTNWGEVTDFSEADLTNARLAGSALSGANLTG